jgi:hypothetical protein
LELRELAELLREYAAGVTPRATLSERLRPVLAADPLDAAGSDPAPWDHAPNETRLFWRLVYLVESGEPDSPEFRDRVRRIVATLDSTRSAASTHELLPIVVDARRLCEIVEKHRSGVISRTSFLSVVAESDYPDHVKLWLQHASPVALARMCVQLGADDYSAVAAGFEAPPA